MELGPGPERVADVPKLKGTITVFLALIFVCVCALVLTLVESARTAGLRFHLDNAAASSMDSLFSEYHNELWNQYRITAYECEDTGVAMSSLEKYMQPYLNVKSWMRMDYAHAQLSQVSYLTDNGGEWLEEEVVDYMTYGLAEDLFNLEVAGDLDSLWKDLREADAMQKITRDYAEKSKEALKVESALTDIDKSLDKQKNLKDDATHALSSGSNGSFQNIADHLIDEMEKVTGGGDGESGLVCVYEDGSYELEEELDRIDEKHAAQYSELSSTDGKEIVDSVKSDYLGYSSDEKDRRSQVEDIYSKTIDNIDMVKLAKEAADLIEEYEEELAEEAAEDEDDSYDYEDEIQDLWDELASTFSAMNIPSLDCEFGVANEEEKGFVEQAKSLLGGDILALVLPEGTSVSTTPLPLQTLPSHTHKNTDRTTQNRTVLENALIVEYIARYYSEFTDEHPGYADYEMEYICAGEWTDRDNLASALGDVFAIREGMNYLSIMRDGAKRSEARHLAEEIVLGASGGTMVALVPVVECLIIGVWAGAETTIDCRALLKGNKVSLVKTPAEWKLDVRSILNWGQSGLLTGPDSGDGRGLDYENYLKFIILLLFSEDRNYRMMDIMQLNLARNEENFRICNCAYAMSADITAEVQHLFTAIPLISTETGGFTRNFSISENAAKAY